MFCKEESLKIIILDSKTERQIFYLSGIAIEGSLSVNGDSPVRKAGNLTLAVNSFSNDQIDDYLQKNKKLILMKEVIEENGNRTWIKLGLFVLTEVNINNSIEGITIDISFADKMCLLNGQCGGTLPASIKLHEYDQINDDGTIIKKQQKIYDIIQSLVVFYGQERIENVIINDIPSEIKNVVRYSGSGNLFFNSTTKAFSISDASLKSHNNWKTIHTGENVGYIWTDFVYPKDLITSIGDSVVSVLEEVSELLGNYEFFYDDNGRFIFQEKKNYLNTSFQNEITKENNNSVINSINYRVDFSKDNAKRKILNTCEGNIISINRSSNISNIKNDFHIWGKKNKDSSDLSVHYHLLIKEKPIINTWNVYFDNNDKIHLADNNRQSINYTPADWRVELYLQGLQKIKRKERLDVLTQEIIDNLGDIYNFKDKKFKTDLLLHPTDISYFIDFIEPVNKLAKYSVDSIGYKTLSEYDEKINAIYELDIPDIMIINMDSKDQKEQIEECIKRGQHYSNVPSNIYNQFSLGTVINTARDKGRELLYLNTNYCETTSIEMITDYSIEVNTRITVQDSMTGLGEDYFINSFSIPLEYEGTMTLSCQQVLERK